MKKLKIGYFADGKWAHNAFELLNVNTQIEIMFICVRFDTKDEVLKQYAEDNNIVYLKHNNINSNEFIETIKQYNCDLLVSMSFNQIFKSEIINLAPLKTINCHAGKLPFYRGRNILNWVLINDEKEFGITVHYVDEGIDTGDIILQEVFPINDSDDYNTLLEIAHTECANVLYKAVKLILDNEVNPIVQKTIHPVGMYCGMRKVGDEILDWHQNSRDIFNFVRAICKPGPQSLTMINDKLAKINKVSIIEDAVLYKGIPGQVVGKIKDGLVVKTLDSTILITEIEFEGDIRIGDRFQCIKHL